MTQVEARHTTLEFGLARYPGINRFALDLVEGRGEASRFCRRPSLDGLTPRPGDASSAALADALVESNRQWGNEVGDLVRSWSEGRAVAIVAGQQVGFGGGPLYTIAKLASLFALRRRLGESGVEAVPFFWLATEDHDYEEISSLLYQSGAELTYLSASAPPGRGRRPVGGMEVPSELLDGLAAKLEMRPPWLRPGITFRDSFAELITGTAGAGMVVLVDSLLPELRKVGAPLFRSMAEQLPEIESAIDASSQELVDAGYRPQVTRKRGAGYSLLYTLEREGVREQVEVREGGVSLAGRRRTLGDLLGRIAAAPESISTGVLARPLLQDFALRPAIFVGGPAEVSYYAQLSSVHEMLGVDPPAIALRGHVLVAPSRRLRALERYGFDPTDLFAPLDRSLADREVDAGKRIDTISGRARAAVEDAVRELEQITAAADPGLPRSLRRSARRIEYHVEKMRARASRATARQDEERWRALSNLQRILYPRGSVQDRVAGWIGWWNLWRDELVPRLTAEARADAPTVRIAGF